MNFVLLCCYGFALMPPFKPIECRCIPSNIGRLVHFLAARAFARIELIITILPWYPVKVSRRLACCCSMRLASSFHSSGASLCTRSAKGRYVKSIDVCLGIELP
jgi:hypothetical protein